MGQARIKKENTKQRGPINVLNPDEFLDGFTSGSETPFMTVVSIGQPTSEMLYRAVQDHATMNALNLHRPGDAPPRVFLFGFSDAFKAYIAKRGFDICIMSDSNSAIFTRTEMRKTVKADDSAFVMMSEVSADETALVTLINNSKDQSVLLFAVKQINDQAAVNYGCNKDRLRTVEHDSTEEKVGWKEIFIKAGCTPSIAASN